MLGIVAVDDVWGLGLFSLLFPLAAWLSGDGDAIGLFASGARELGGGIALGMALRVQERLPELARFIHEAPAAKPNPLPAKSVLAPRVLNVLLVRLRPSELRSALLGERLRLLATHLHEFTGLGTSILPLVIVATVVFELAGPPCTPWALGRAGDLRA